MFCAPVSSGWGNSGDVMPIFYFLGASMFVRLRSEACTRSSIAGNYP
jgi:hypothetical protein